jgi:hypothetical protein
MGFMDQEIDCFDISTSAREVEKGFPVAVACVEGLAFFKESSESRDVVGPNGMN